MPRHTTPDQPPTDPGPAKASTRLHRAGLIFAVLLILSPVLLALGGNLEFLAQILMAQFPPPQPLIGVDEIRPAPPPPEVPEAFTFESSALHPDRLYRRYFATPMDRFDTTDAAARRIEPFRELLTLYMRRQGEDDNFTMRVLDNRDMRTLEVFTLTEARADYERTGHFNWIETDKQRRKHTGRLVAKYEKLGFPKEAISVRWGRANQVRAAREREAPYISYEVRLARYLGLSLLVTEIGTVETFNDDRLVSSVGARGRYQMMPFNLRKFGIEHYNLQSAYGTKVSVSEEWHPMLTMEPAFILLRGYVNAVGHEIPGISAYHTGPGNIFNLYKLFLTDHPELLTPETSVIDAFVWALTDGFETVSSTTSFRAHSRGYVPSGYGSLRAVEDLPIDTTRTFLAERVQLQPGRDIFLSNLLEVLSESGRPLHWGPATGSPGLYERFRQLNPHFDLPEAEDDGSTPPEGDVRLVHAAGEAPVRFFLPLYASNALSAAGIDILDNAATRTYDDSRYRLTDKDRTRWDRAYADLQRDIRQFGFSRENRQRLSQLAAIFEDMAAHDATPYRLLQRDIIRIHRQLWNYSGWDELAAAAEAAGSNLPPSTRPPSPLDVKPLPIRPPTTGVGNRRGHGD
jgi:hypothetical protein